MSKRALRCTIISAADGWMIIQCGRWQITATCRITMNEAGTELIGTVRSGGPESWLHRDIEVLTADNQNGTITLAA
jgi:hypothetical protein